MNLEMEFTTGGIIYFCTYFKPTIMQSQTTMDYDSYESNGLVEAIVHPGISVANHSL